MQRKRIEASASRRPNCNWPLICLSLLLPACACHSPAPAFLRECPRTVLRECPAAPEWLTAPVEPMQPLAPSPPITLLAPVTPSVPQAAGPGSSPTAGAGHEHR